MLIGSSLLPGPGRDERRLIDIRIYITGESCLVIVAADVIIKLAANRTAKLKAKRN
ncbi:MAG: hypothetical protein ACHQIM_14680 [Sphingobacteriales bacterium]